MRYAFGLFWLLLMASNSALVSAQQRVDGLAAVAPFVNEQTLAIASVDLARLDLPAMQKQFFDPMVNTDGERIAVTFFFDKLRALSDQLRVASGGRVYLVVSLSPAPDIRVSSSSFGVTAPSVFAI